MCLPKDGHAHALSRNRNLIRFLQSFVVLPVITVAMPFTGLVGVMKADTAVSSSIALAEPSTAQVVPASPSLAPLNLGKLALDQAMDEKAQILEAQGKAIDAYFKTRNMPLYGTGLKMATEADKNGIDWRLLPAIAVRESTGGKHACKSAKNSFFGWGSCKISFNSKEEAIETVARNLGGNNPNTDHHYSKGKTTKQILEKYNPRSIVAHYPEQVMAIMDAIGPEDVTLKATTAVAKT